MKFIFPLLCFFPLLGQTELYLPWVPQNETFQSTLIINNHQPEAVEVQLQALRTFGESETITLEIGAFASVQRSAGALFTELGQGSGYVVSITSTAHQLSASCVVASTTTESGDSPSQMNAIAGTKASPLLAFNYLPLTNAGFSAPVVVNLGTSPGIVTFHGFKDGVEIGTSQRNLLPGEVFARQTSEMFPGVEGGLYVIAESAQPLVGASFIFNGSREPAMAAAEPISTLPDPFSVLTALRIDPSNSQLRINQPQALVAEGTFLQGPTQVLTEDVAWSSSNSAVVTVDNSGADKGTVTARQAGSAVITATLDGISDELTVTVLPPRLKIELGLGCSSAGVPCSLWRELSVPTNLTSSGGAFFQGEATLDIATFRISSEEGPFTISEITVENLSGNNAAGISGLQVGQTIQAGQLVNFFPNASRTFGEEHRIRYTIGVEGQGTVFTFTASFQSN